ncbi:type I toxin-antitoxin system SymE family toxin [Paraburkholderia sp. RP-4-7]|uniref:Type I toxin-antitoxin system SymE family toxin n=1 Tax=Paraburkholderia polaris TaxID=2728848 RepID=A0A848IC61_9BURK|nr:hypothetical protein [Paraburkholderia polaris]NMM00048.1 type I toxin-antitoxin system SymE family toxin [Paraburkholderia polaris]
MANANLKAQPRKPRKARQPEYEHRSGILRNTPDPGPMASDGQPYFPWMEIADRWLASAGFKPGDHVSFSIDYRHAQLIIRPFLG